MPAPTSAAAWPRHPSERRAARWYRLRGYRMLDTNCWLAGAELDVVARRGRVLVFCRGEVQGGDGFGDPLEMVDAAEGRPGAAGGGGVARRHPDLGRARRALRRDRRAGRPDRAPGGRVLGSVAAAANSASWRARRSRSTRASTSTCRGPRASCPSASGRSTSTACIPYLGKYVPQLVEELFRRHVPARGRCSIRSPARERRSSRHSRAASTRPASTSRRSTAC